MTLIKIIFLNSFLLYFSSLFKKKNYSFFVKGICCTQCGGVEDGVKICFWISSSHIQKGGVAVHACNPTLGGRFRQILWTHSPGNLAKMMIFLFSERPSLVKALWQKVIEEDFTVLLWLPYAYTWTHTLTFTYMNHTHTHTPHRTYNMQTPETVVTSVYIPSYVLPFQFLNFFIVLLCYTFFSALLP